MPIKRLMMKIIVKKLPTYKTDANHQPRSVEQKISEIVLMLCGLKPVAMGPGFTDVYWMHGVTTKNH